MWSRPTPSTYYVRFFTMSTIQCTAELIADPPSAPFIHGYTEGSHIPAGTVQKISCTSSGGNPLATLTWYKNDKKINSLLKTTDKSVTAEITILTNVTDNEARYRCEAANSATEIPLFETITMNVFCE
jgi:hypothetical protein